MIIDLSVNPTVNYLFKQCDFNDSSKSFKPFLLSHVVIVQ